MRGKTGPGVQFARQNPSVVLELRRHGLTQAQSAQVLGCSEDTILRVLATFPKAERARLPKNERDPAGAVQMAKATKAGTVVAVPRRAPKAGGLSLAEKRARSTEDYAQAFAAADGDVRATATAMGVSPQAVRRRLDLSKPIPRPAMPTARMVELYSQGHSLKQVADAAGGIHRDAVSVRLRAAGVELRSPGGANHGGPATVLHAHEHEVCALFMAGATQRLLASEFDCSPATVFLLLASHGAKRRNCRLSPTKKAALRKACREVRAGHLAVKHGQLVRRQRDPRTLAPIGA